MAPMHDRDHDTLDHDTLDHHTLEARDLCLAYDGRTVVDGLSLQVPTGAVTAVVGANACGKSTLLRGLARVLQPQSGAVLLDGRSIHERPTKEVAAVLGCSTSSVWVRLHRARRAFQDAHDPTGGAR